MGLDITYDEGQTPLEEDEKEGLLIPSVTTKGELDELEQQNIQAAMLWAEKRRRIKPEKVLTEEFIIDLHKRMLKDVWRWAGSFRITDKNIGVSKYQIGVELRMLLDDCNYWIEHEVYLPDEIAIRFKHKLVSIHCFANGNGRHSRLMADIIIEKVLGGDVFTWGQTTLKNISEERRRYITALRAADNGDLGPLISFARS